MPLQCPTSFEQRVPESVDDTSLLPTSAYDYHLLVLYNSQHWDSTHPHKPPPTHMQQLVFLIHIHTHMHRQIHTASALLYTIFFMMLWNKGHIILNIITCQESLVEELKLFILFFPPFLSFLCLFGSMAAFPQTVNHPLIIYIQ